MKAYLFIPAAALLGVLVGAWGPREELRAYKKQVAEEKARPNRLGADGFADFAKMVKIPEMANPHRRPKKKRPEMVLSTNRVVKTQVATTTNEVSDVETNATVKTEVKKPKRLSPEDLRARIEEAQDLWATRVEIARTQWKNKLKMSDEASARFDAAMDEMNLKLLETAQAMADQLAQQDKMTPELGLRLMGDAATVMAETYEKVGACVSPEQRADVSEIPLTDFIDPGVAEPLIAVQGKLENFRPMGRLR